MINLFDILLNVKLYKDLEIAIQEGMHNIFLSNSVCMHSSFIASLLCKKINKNLVIVVPNELTGQKICNDVNIIFGEEVAMLFKSREIIYRNVESSSKEYEHQRLKVIYNLCNIENKIIKPIILVVTVEALHQILNSPSKYKQLLFNLKVGDVAKIENIAKTLIKLGYVRSYQVDGIGQFSIRGEILDIYPPHLEYPVRIDFWDDEIDNIFLFDAQTQRKIDKRLDNVVISPAKEVLIEDVDEFIQSIEKLQKELTNLTFKDEVINNITNDIDNVKNGIVEDNIDKYIPIILKNRNNIIDYIDEPIIFIMNYSGVINESKSVLWHYLQDVESLVEEKILTKDFGSHILHWDEIKQKFEKYINITTSEFNSLLDNYCDFDKIIDCYQKELSCWSGNINLLEDDIRIYIEKNFKIIILAGSKAFAKYLIEELKERKISVSSNLSDIYNFQIIVLDECLTSGIEYSIYKLVIFTVSKNNLFKKNTQKKRKKFSNEVAIGSLEDISIGDYVVHANHGIGIFDGINKLELQGVIKDYIKIKYLGSDILYVPVTQLDLVSKYIGNKEDGVIKLNKLNSSDWYKKCYQVKKAVKDMAKDLIKLQSERINSKGYQFSADNDWQLQFEDMFEYEETDAQLRCIEEVKKDMEKPYPMDRLICGDVGVGKTEVALRMAFKAVMDFKQVAILAPTTILSWQHYNTIINRMNKFPIKVELLSRLKTPKQQKDIINKLKTGEVEIVVGTHRLLQKDVEFKDLGLIIIDEEQRFGVADKEKFKKMKHNVDVLTLSATPIPRTLNMAMSGIRDMSVIDEMPQDRLPIQTYVLEYNENIIVTAIIKEMKRGGMVFYLHNRVETINQVAAKIATLIPDVRICIAHGKMLQNELTEIWQKLLNHEADVLICTTIIETGIDIPFCNTLIVEDADKMGLAQLHQLRGRIGRSDKRAFAYMTFKKGKTLSEISTKRLLAIKEFTKFGAGFKIALRDLEIRGAGNILGSQQHGHIDSVGYDMYLKLLSESIAEEKGEKPDLLASEKCVVDIDVTAYLPEKYIPSLPNRIDIYKKIALIKSKDDYDDLVDELVDRFGELPVEVEWLLSISFLRNLAIKNNIEEIKQKGENIYIYQNPLNMEMAAKISQNFGEKVTLNLNDRQYIKIKIYKNEKSFSVIQDILSVL